MKETKAKEILLNHVGFFNHEEFIPDILEVMEEYKNAVEDKEAVITITVKDKIIYVHFKNDGFSYYEINGLLHDIITNETLLKIAGEELKVTKEKDDNGDITSVIGGTQINA